MLIQEKIGHISSYAMEGKEIDHLALEWYETGKRIMRKHTRGGRELALRFLKESPSLTEGDVLYADDKLIIAIAILPCEAMVIRMGSFQVVASACYEIGNRHLPLFIEGDMLLAPFEEPLYRWLLAGGYAVSREERKLLYPLRSTVPGHAHADAGSSLFSKIMQITHPRT